MKESDKKCMNTEHSNIYKSDHNFNYSNWRDRVIQTFSRGRILGRNWDKSLKSFSSLLFTIISIDGFYSPGPWTTKNVVSVNEDGNTDLRVGDLLHGSVARVEALLTLLHNLQHGGHQPWQRQPIGSKHIHRRPIAVALQNPPFSYALLPI